MNQKFCMTSEKIDALALANEMQNDMAGAYVAFEGRVRNHNEGHAVRSLEYQSYEALALNEANLIFQECQKKYDVLQLLAVHRVGHLQIGDVAVWVGVLSKHRKEAYAANRFLIDQIKFRLPIWKKEYYVDKPAEWVQCHGCDGAHA